MNIKLSIIIGNNQDLLGDSIDINILPEEAIKIDFPPSMTLEFYDHMHYIHCICFDIDTNMIYSLFFTIKGFLATLIDVNLVMSGEDGIVYREAISVNDYFGVDGFMGVSVSEMSNRAFAEDTILIMYPLKNPAFDIKTISVKDFFHEISNMEKSSTSVNIPNPGIREIISLESIQASADTNISTFESGVNIGTAGTTINRESLISNKDVDEGLFKFKLDRNNWQYVKDEKGRRVVARKGSYVSARTGFIMKVPVNKPKVYDVVSLHSPFTDLPPSNSKILRISGLETVNTHPNVSGNAYMTHSPTSDHLAYGCDGSPYLFHYKKIDGVYNLLDFDYTVPTAAIAAAEYSPNGEFLALAVGSLTRIMVYKRNGDSLNLVNVTGVVSSIIKGLAWSPDSNYLYAVHVNSPFISIFKRDGDNFARLANPSILPSGESNNVAASSNGVYVAVVHHGYPYLTIYKKSGDTFTKLSNPSNLPNATMSTVKFNGGSNHLLLGGVNTNPNGGALMLYTRSGDVFTHNMYGIYPPIVNSAWIRNIAFIDNDKKMLVGANNHGNTILEYVTNGNTYVLLPSANITVPYGRFAISGDKSLLFVPRPWEQEPGGTVSISVFSIGSRPMEKHPLRYQDGKITTIGNRMYYYAFNHDTMSIDIYFIYNNYGDHYNHLNDFYSIHLDEIGQEYLLNINSPSSDGRKLREGNNINIVLRADRVNEILYVLVKYDNTSIMGIKSPSEQYLIGLDARLTRSEKYDTNRILSVIPLHDVRDINNPPSSGGGDF
jgi:hypothetical protein